MAWPFSSLRTYVAGTTPTIKAADLNSIQDYITHIFNGYRSVKKFVVDGTGDVDTSGGTYIAGAATLNGDSGDTAACISTTRNPTTRKLLWVMSGGTTPVRLYVSDNGYEIVTNASFSTPNWTQDVGVSASQILTLNANVYLSAFKPAGSAAWTDTYSNDTASTTAWLYVSASSPVAAAAGGELLINRILGYTPAPTIVAGAALGATPTNVQITSGSDVSGLMSFTTDAAAVGAAGTIATVTFANVYSTAPYVVLSNATTAAADIGLAGVVRVIASTTQFVLTTPTVNPLINNKTYDLNYMVIG